jgi:predicted dehydrogenase
MDSRRKFIGRMATGIAGTLAAPASVLGSNSRVRLGIIGAGERGMTLAREALASPNTELAAFADVYTRRLEAAHPTAPGAKTYADFRRMLEDPSVDAVVIATPQHLHAAHFVAALEAGKHVYLEKTMALTVAGAKSMRAAFRAASGRVVQIGHNNCSSGQVADARHFLDTGLAGTITSIRAHMYRNTPHGKPQWARPIYPDMTEENIDWQAFLGEAPPLAFDANRYANWRYYWDYSGGNFHENMSQQLAFWSNVLNLGVPNAVTASGGLYLWKDGREVPDTMNAALEYDGRMLFAWDSGFGNSHYGVGEDVLGTDGTISRSQQIRYTPQKVNRPNGIELVGQSRPEANAHMRNFIEAIRGGAEVNCPFETGWRVSIACHMAVESFRQGRTVRWDPVREEIA